MTLADSGVILAFVLAPITILGTAAAIYPIVSQWRKRELLAKRFGSEFFDRPTIDNSTRY
ncbi:hypothetical protein C2W62_32355 [Candidatus Entotheonella serta]|nr:hypothetical protein C2W62_32355 [Candidatus Entotheonella serta]